MTRRLPKVGGGVPPCLPTLIALSLAFLAAGGSAFAQRTDPVVIMDTTKGRIAMVIFRSAVPRTAENFLELVDSGFYNGLGFHRVEPWVVQGGDPNGNGSGHFIDPATGAPRFIPLEVHRRLGHNAAGMVAMARSAHPDSASCQFYILKQPRPQLNGKYSVFGRVIQGIHVVHNLRPGDRIIRAGVDRGEGVTTAPGPTHSKQPLGPGLSIFNKPKSTPTGDPGF